MSCGMEADVLEWKTWCDFPYDGARKSSMLQFYPDAYNCQLAELFHQLILSYQPSLAFNARASVAAPHNWAHTLNRKENLQVL